ncbi:glycosyltransferase, partial [Candidatus Parcubacteria bacterium]|nr:glycosyltransferase [Candidatus Parcubacteria bacterium]
MKNQTPKIVKIGLTGGGTGGHLIPLVAVVRELKKILKDRVIFYYLGP